MKKQFKNRKAFQDIARELGIQDKTHHVIYTDPITKQDSMRLINNYSRFVNGMLNLSPMEQLEKLQLFKANMQELVEAQKQAQTDMQDSIKDLKIENPLANLGKQILDEQVEDEAFKL